MDKLRTLLAIGLAVGLTVIIATGCIRKKETAKTTTTDSHHTTPVYESAIVITDNADTLQPVRLQWYFDTLFVSYNGRSQIDLFSSDLQKLRSIIIAQPMNVTPTSFVVAESIIVIADHSSSNILVYDRDGKFLDSYGTLPDKETKLQPFDLTFFGGVLYVADIGQRQIMAISMTDAGDVTEKGELILSFPNDSLHSLGFPSALKVTPDGRMLVGDAGEGVIKVFTCDGRYVYDFDKIETPAPLGPQAFAMDDVVDPAMQDSSSWDPSGIRLIGRFHVADANNGVIHLYNSLGKYLASYPGDGRLQRPSGVAVDRGAQRVFVADPAAKRLLTFTYEK